MEDVLAKTILTELRDFGKENSRKWEENEKRWEENNKRWEQNEKRWEENDRRWEQNEKRWKENDRKWNRSNNQRKKDRKELFEILNTIDKSITKQFDYMEKYIDSGYDKILENQLKCNKEYILLKREIETQKARMNFQNVRIESLEKWRDNVGDSFLGIS